MGERSDSYRAELEAANPNNRFMRRRNGTYSNVERILTPRALWTITQTARHMVQNDALPGQMIERLADNVIQGGFRLVMQTPDDGLNEDLGAMVEEWANDPQRCDYYGQYTLSEQCWLSFVQTAQDGEVFFLFVDDGRLQMVENDRCVGSDPYLGGVKRDSDGRIVSYRFSRSIPMTYFAADKDTEEHQVYDDEGFRQVAHLYCPKRRSQCHGYSWFTPIMVKAGMLDDLEFATVIKAQTAATIAGVAERTTSTAPAVAKTLGYQNANASGPNGTETTTDMRGGLIVDLPFGRKLAGFAPVVPNSEHFQHVQHTIKEIGAALNMPVEMVLLDSGVSNFSGTRMAMDNARMSFQRLQRTWVSSFLCPMLKWKIRQWLPRLGRAAQTMAATGDLFSHRWIAPSWRYIQPVEQATGAAIELENNIVSPREVVGRQGRDYADVVAETVEDNGAMIAAALAKAQEIKAKFPDADVNWREIARMRLPNGMVQTDALNSPQRDDANSVPAKPAPNRTTQAITEAMSGAREQDHSKESAA